MLIRSAGQERLRREACMAGIGQNPGGAGDAFPCGLMQRMSASGLPRKKPPDDAIAVLRSWLTVRQSLPRAASWAFAVDRIPKPVSLGCALR